MAKKTNKNPNATRFYNYKRTADTIYKLLMAKDAAILSLHEEWVTVGLTIIADVAPEIAITTAPADDKELSAVIAAIRSFRQKNPIEPGNPPSRNGIVDSWYYVIQYAARQ